MSDELVDVLVPPMFEKSGIIKTRKEASAAGDWIGIYHLWIVRSVPVPSIVYQVRSANKAWAPNKLDTTVGGHYIAGEEITERLREAEEEIGRKYRKDQLQFLGQKLYVGYETSGANKHNVIDLFFVQDDASLESYKLDENEVYAVTSIPVSDLIALHSGKVTSLKIELILHNSTKIQRQIDKDSFPENYDRYHFKMALLADRYFKGEKNLIY